MMDSDKRFRHLSADDKASAEYAQVAMPVIAIMAAPYKAGVAVILQSDALAVLAEKDAQIARLTAERDALRAGPVLLTDDQIDAAHAMAVQRCASQHGLSVSDLRTDTATVTSFRHAVARAVESAVHAANPKPSAAPVAEFSDAELAHGLTKAAVKS